jgi:hydroxymethylglutaryl-CoA reductase (NADPH)
VDKPSEKEKVEKRRGLVEEKTKTRLLSIASYCFDPQATVNRNIENMIGATQVPLGIAGPMKLKTKNQRPKTYFLPLATTEGALVASVNRGCKATRLSGGIKTFVKDVGVSRAPVFKVKDLREAEKLVEWTKKHFKKLKKTAEKTSGHLKLLEIRPTFFGRNVYLRFLFNTDEAMGMNMVTKGSKAMVDLIEKSTETRCVSVSGNFCVDKKPNWQNVILGRGKKVWAEAILKAKIVREVLKTSSEKIAEVVYRKCLLGSSMAGSLGFNSHFANIAAAIFLAIGQDMAHVTEASLGMTTAEVLKDGRLYFSVYLPDLMVGTVGGGTGLATQKEALSILGLGKGKKGEALELARIIGGAVLCGELSLVAALSAGHLVKAHEKLGRGKK